MRLTSIGRLISVFVIIISMLYFGYRAYQHRDKPSRSVFLFLFAVHLLDIIAAINSVKESLLIPVSKSMNLIGYVGFSFAVIIGYFAIEQFLNNTTYSIRDIIRRKKFLITSISIIVMAILLLLRNDDFSFTDGVFFEPIWSYAIPYSIYYLIFVFLGILIAKMFWIDIKTNEENSAYVIRRTFCMIAILIVVFATSLAEFNLIFSFLAHNPYMSFINWFVQDVAKGLAFFLLLLGFAIPQNIFTAVIQPFEQYTERRQYQLLYYLCQAMAQIVPNKQLPQKDFDILPILIKISEMREVIWSHEYHRELLTPQVEAEHLIDCIRSKTTYSKSGQYQPAPTLRDHHHVFKHNLAVAKHLKQLERQHSDLFRSKPAAHKRIWR